MKCICGKDAVQNQRKEKGFLVDKAGISRQTLLTVAQCKGCGLLRQIRLPFSTEEEYVIYYENEYPPIDQAYTKKNYEHDREVAKQRCEDSIIETTTEDKVLDIGCGSGAFVDECRELGIEAFGCEIAKYAYSKDHSFIYHKQFEKVHFPTDFFSTVTCYDVVEHVFDPLSLLKEAFRVTKQKGKCVFEIPRFHHKSGRRHWKAIEHIWYFTTEQFEKLLLDVGFVVNDIEHPIESKTTYYVTKPTQNRVKILLPPGIGDSYWSITKLQAFIEREQCGLPDIYIACNREKQFNGHKRAFPFIEMFPFLNSSENTIGNNRTPFVKKLWKEAYADRGRTIFRDVVGCDYFISYNGHLRYGERMEDNDPDLETNWFPPMFVSLEQDRFKKQCKEQFGKYIVFYFVFKGTYQYWTKQFSVEKVIQFINDLSEKTGCTPVIAGAIWDKVKDDLLKKVKNKVKNCVDMTGKTSVEQLFGMLRGSELVVGYPSGLTIASALLKQKTLVIWNDYYDKDFVYHGFPPSVRNTTYFAVDTKGLMVDQLVSTSISIMDKEKPNIELIKKETVKEELKETVVKKPLKRKSLVGSNMITAVCVLKSGGHFKKPYVMKLRDALQKYLPIKHRFVCMTDLILPDSIEQIPLIHDWPRWWSKIELFRPGLFNGGTVLYFDLDVVFTDEIDMLAIYPHKFSMLDPFNPSHKHGDWASGMMAWSGDFSHIYEKFVNEASKVMKKEHGDQTFIARNLGRVPESLQGIQSGIYSYKRHCKNGVPEDAKIVCFHGRPRLHQVDVDWVNKYWNGYE